MKEHSISKIFESTMHDFRKALSKDTGRADEIGGPREKQVHEFLKHLLPEKIGVAKGYVINQIGSISKECDIVFFNKESCPKFMLDTENNLRLFPIEEVYGIAEVKSTLNLDELNNAVSKLDSVKTIYQNRFEHIPQEHESVMSTADGSEPFKIIFSYKAGDKWDDFEFLCRLHGTNAIDAVFLLDEGAYIKATDDTLARRNSFSKKVPFQVSEMDNEVWTDITRRFCEDRSSHYDDYLSSSAKDDVLLLMMYTFILDAVKKVNLPNYNSGDYIVFWAEKARASFNSNGAE